MQEVAQQMRSSHCGGRRLGTNNLHMRLRHVCMGIDVVVLGCATVF